MTTGRAGMVTMTSDGENLKLGNLYAVKQTNTDVRRLQGNAL
ncbi:MAG: hypothetical protein WKF84_05215 [Pyrinomonadaceae bacterium]